MKRPAAASESLNKRPASLVNVRKDEALGSGGYEGTLLTALKECAKMARQAEKIPVCGKAYVLHNGGVNPQWKKANGSMQLQWPGGNKASKAGFGECDGYSGTFGGWLDFAPPRFGEAIFPKAGPWKVRRTDGRIGNVDFTDPDDESVSDEDFPLRDVRRKHSQFVGTSPGYGDVPKIISVHSSRVAAEKLKPKVKLPAIVEVPIRGTVKAGGLVYIVWAAGSFLGDGDGSGAGACFLGAYADKAISEARACQAMLQAAWGSATLVEDHLASDDEYCPIELQKTGNRYQLKCDCDDAATSSEHVVISQGFRLQ